MIFRASVTAWLKVPAFAVIVTVDDPTAATATAARVKVPTVAELAVKDGVTPIGSPETPSKTGLLNPFCGVRVSVVVPEAPCARLRDVGESDNVKEGGLAMLSAIDVLALNVPDVPVMVAVALPAAAEVPAVNVTVVEPVAVAGLKLAVTPEGRPDAASFTDPLNPFCGLIAMELDPLVPAVRLSAAGVAERVKLGAATTVIAIVAVLVSAPEMPVTVSVALPGDAFADALTVSVLLRVLDARLNVAVTPVGKPAIEKLTAAVKPFCGVTVIVLAPLAPSVMLRLAGDAAMLKPGVGAAPTVSDTLAVLLRFPDVPVIVTVAAPIAAEFDAVSVRVLVELEPTVLKLAVTPLGRPEAESVTFPWNPFCGVITMLLVAKLPRARLRLAGAAERVNEGVAAMVSDIRAVLVRLPDVPVTVRVEVDAAAELLATTVRTLEVVALAGLNDAVTPAGNPETLRFTAPLKPCCGLMMRVLVALAPGATLSVEADADRLKPGELDVEVRLLMSAWPAGVPHPVARS